MNNISINSSTWTSIGFGSCLVASNSRTELVHFKLGTTQLVSSYLGSQIHLENDGELFAKSNSRDVTLEVTEIDKDTRDNTAAIEAAMQALQDNSDADALTKSELAANTLADTELAGVVTELEGRITSLEEAPASPGGGEGGVAGMFLDDGREIKMRHISVTRGAATWFGVYHGLEKERILSVSCTITTAQHAKVLAGATNATWYYDLQIKDSYIYVSGDDNPEVSRGTIDMFITYLA